MAQKFTITAELNLQTKNLSQVVNNLKQQFQGANLNIKIKDLAKAEASVRNISKGAKEAQGSFNSLGGSIALAAKKFTAITLATGTFVGLARAVKGAVSDAVEFEREMVKIAQATGKTVAQLQALRNEVGSVASGFGVSSKELIEAARNLTQAGFAADKVTGALKLLAQTELAATFDSIGDTTEGVIAILNQFGREAQRTGNEISFLEKSLSAINQVSKEYAVESSDLITAIRTTGSAFETAGGSLDELIALFTSVRSTTRESAESIATGFRTIFTRTQRLDTINNLKKLGIELQDAEGKFVGPMEATKRLSIALSSIDPKDFRFNLIVEQLGGFRQVSKVIPLIQQFGVAQKALNVAQGSSGSLAKDAATAQQSLAVQIQKTREEFSRFIRDLTESKSFKDTAKFLLEMANAFIKVADVLKPLIPMMAGFAAIKIGQAFLPGVKSLVGAGQKRHEGGKIHAFASGGLVPGSGNSDTVPAMLTPGEFVIKKSSVKKLGVDSLASANKYASGGRVTISPEPDKYGIFALEPENAPDKDNYSTGAKVTNAKVAAKLRIEAAKQLKVKKLSDDTEVAIGGTLKSFHVGDDSKDSVRQTFKDSTDKAFSQLLTTVSNDVASKVGAAPITPDNKSLQGAIGSLFKQDSKSAKNAIEGYVLEGVTSVIGKTDLAGGQENWDFPNPSGAAKNLGRLFGQESSIANLNDADAKRTDSATVRADVLATKLSKTLAEEPGNIKSVVQGRATKEAVNPTQKVRTLGDLVKELEPSYAGTTFNIPGSPYGGKLSTANISHIIENMKDVRVKGLKTASPLDPNLEEVIVKALATDNSLKFKPTQNKASGGSIASLTDIPWMASGGQASGSDTVPAMLTPGEFVINKKSAEKIGGSTLNRMNKVGKFAKGGPVGVQYLSPGGRLNAAFPLPPNAFGSKAASAGNIPSSSSSKPPIDDKAAERLKDELNKIAEASQRTGTGLILLGSAVTSIVSQMSGLDKAYADGITAAAGTFSTIYGIGQSLKSTGVQVAASLITEKKHKKSVDDDTTALKSHSTQALAGSGSGEGAGAESTKFIKGFKVAVESAERAITGFAIGAAAQSALAAYDQAKAQKESDKLDKAMERFVKSLNNEAEVRSGMISTLVLAEKAQARSNAATSKKAMGGSVIGTGIGIAVGAVLEKKFKVKGATAALGTAGGAVGSFLGGEAANQYDDKKTRKNANLLSDTFLESTKGINTVNKLMEGIDKKDTGKVSEALNGLDAGLIKAQNALNSFDPDVLTNGSEEQKQQYNKAAESVAAFSQAVDRVSGELKGRLLKDMQNAAKVGVVYNEEKLKPTFAKEETRIKEKNASIYDPAIERAANRKGKDGKPDKMGKVEAGELTKLKEQTSNKEIAENKKLLLESSIQILKQEKALIRERAARDKVIGSLIQENALKASLEKFNYAVNQAAKGSDEIDAAFSDSVQGLKSSIPDSSVFDLEFPDSASLNAALEQVKAIGPIGEQLAGNLLDLNKVVPNLDTALERLAAKGFGDLDITKDLDKVIKEAFDIDVSGPVGQALKDMIESSYKDEDNKGGAGTIDREKIKKQFEEFAKELKEKGKGIVSAMEQAEQKQRTIADKINQTEQRKLELANQGVDSYSRMTEAIAKAMGKDVPLVQKNAMRFSKMMNMLGNSAGKSIPQIGKDLSDARKKLGSGTLKPLDAARVSNEAKNLEQALKNLADQSGRTSDTLNELEKYKAQREQVQKNLTDYAFGSDEDRQSMDNAAAATNQALQTGDISSVEGPMRKEVLNMLDTMGDFGKQAKKQLTANYFQSQGHPELAQAAMAETTTPEQQLIGELQNIYQQEIAAQKELMNMQDEIGNSQIAEYKKITEQLAGYNEQLKNLYNDFKSKDKKAGDATGDKTPKLTTTLIDTEIKKMETQVTNLTKNIETFNSNIDLINKKMREIEEVKANGGKPVEVAAPPAAVASVKAAQGGLVYLAQGGDTFKPKGTDTVPAMLTPGEFVMKKSAVDRIGSDNLNAMNKGGKVSYYAGGGLVDSKVQERIDKAKTEEERYDLAKGYANSQKNAIDIKIEQPGAFGRLMGRKAEPDYSSLKKIMIGIGKKEDGSYENQVSLESILKGGSANLFKTKEGFQGGDVFARELSDDDQARALAFTDASSGAIPSFGRGVLQGMTSMPFVDIASIIGQAMGYDIDKLEWQGKPIGSLTKASLYDVVARNYLPSAPSDENSKYWEEWGLEGGKLLNPLEWLTGSVAAGAGSKLMKFVATKGIVGRTVAKAATSGSSFIFKAIDDIVSWPFKKIGGVIKKGLGKGAAKGGSELVQEGGEAVLKSSVDAPLKRLTADQIKEKVAKEAIEKEAKEKAAKELAEKQTKETAEQVQKQAALEAEQKKALEQTKKQKAQDSAENIKKEKGSDTTMDEDWAKAQAEGKTIKPKKKSVLSSARTAGAVISALVGGPETDTPPPEIAPSELKKTPDPVAEVAPVAEAAPVDETKPVETAAATTPEEKKKKKRRRRGMNPNAMMPMMGMGIPNWIQQATAQAQAAQQQAQSSWFDFMNQGPQVIAGPGFRYFASGGMAKGTDTVPAMLTPGEFVMNKSAVDKHGVGMMQHLNSGGEVKYLAGGGMIPLGMSQTDYDDQRILHEEKKEKEAKQREENAKRFAEKEKARAAKVAPTMNRIGAERKEKNLYNNAKAQDGKTLSMGPNSGPPTFLGDQGKKIQGPELPIGQGRAVTPVELGSSKPAPASTASPSSEGNSNARRTLAARNARRSGSGDINVGSMANNAMVNAGQQQGPGSLNALREVAQRRASEGKPPATPAITPPAAAAGAAGAAAAAMATPAPVAGAAAAGAAGATAATPEAPRRPSTQKGAGGPMRDRAIQANAAMKANRMGFQQMMMNRNRPRTRSQMMSGGGGGMGMNPMAQMQQQQQMQQAEGGGGGAAAGSTTQGQSGSTSTGGQGGGGGGADMSSFAASVESLNKITETFSKFTETLSGIAAQFSNLTVSHNVTVAGAINVQGVDSGKISDTISKALTDMVSTTVKTQLEAFKAKNITGTQG